MNARGKTCCFWVLTEERAGIPRDPEAASNALRKAKSTLAMSSDPNAKRSERLVALRGILGAVLHEHVHSNDIEYHTPLEGILQSIEWVVFVAEIERKCDVAFTLDDLSDATLWRDLHAIDELLSRRNCIGQDSSSSSPEAQPRRHP